jgi:hypothetical protein
VENPTKDIGMLNPTYEQAVADVRNKPKILIMLSYPNIWKGSMEFGSGNAEGGKSETKVKWNSEGGNEKQQSIRIRKSDPASFCRSQNYAAAIDAGIGKIALYARS